MLTDIGLEHSTSLAHIFKIAIMGAMGTQKVTKSYRSSLKSSEKYKMLLSIYSDFYILFVQDLAAPDTKNVTHLQPNIPIL